jgi:glyoxylase-like metal-dependent hydrolase (beta-lactamase superfamily II)
MSQLSATFTLGALEIAALSDGAPELPLDIYFDTAEPAEWTAALGISDVMQPVPFGYSSFLIRGDGHTTLIDTGYGALARRLKYPGGGELLDRLDEFGVGRDEIDRVVHTHLHPDHCAWNTNVDAAGEITFPNATIYVARAELDHWEQAELDGDFVAKIARANTRPYLDAGRLELTEGETAVSEALTMVPTPGHTPGHCSMLLTSQGEHLVITGDAADHPAHLEHHDWIPAFDLDHEESTRSRGKLARLAVEKDALVTGGHFPILTLGRLREVEAGYRWEADSRGGVAD